MKHPRIGQRTLNPFRTLLTLTLLLLVGGSPALADITVELHPDNDVRVVNGTHLAAPEAADGPEFSNVTPGDAASVTVRFPRFSPDLYVQGSGQDLDLIVDGALPSAATVTVTAWHLGNRAAVGGFDVSLSSESWSIPADELDKIPVGQVELRAVLTAPGLRQVEVAQRYVILPPGSEPIDLASWYDDPEPFDYDESAGPPKTLVPGEGFIAYTPEPGQQIYYVSATGSDGNDGRSEATPLRTLREAYKRVGDGDGDWILLKAGDTFSGGFGHFAKSGASKDEPFYVGVYGQGDRPIIHTNGDGFIFAYGKASHVVIDGLYVYANDRQPFERAIYWLARGEDITLQDMKIEGFLFNVVFQAEAHGLIRDVAMRRCIILDSYGHYEGHKGGHSSGLYMQNVVNALIDECTFDHNGWNPDVKGATKTMFNHNVYVQNDCRYVNFYRSIFSRGASHGVQLRCGGEIVNNLFVRNALAALVGQDPSLMADNVVLEADDISSSNPNLHRGSGLEVMPCSHAVVENNLAVDKVGSAKWSGGIEVKWRTDIVTPPDRFFVEIRNNTVARWPRAGGRPAIEDWSGNKADVVFSGNVLDQASGGDGPVRFVDDSRDCHTYLPGGYAAFLEGARNRGRGEWDPTFGAATFNQWMREGYQLR